MAVETNIRLVRTMLQGFTTKLVKKIALDATANLIEDNPVDTGWSRANWIPGIGPPPANPAGLTGGRDAQGRFTAAAPDVGAARSAQEQGVALIATSYDISQGNVSITNNVPYIRFLNEGSSQQAPAMFVERAVARALLGANTLRSP